MAKRPTHRTTKKEREVKQRLFLEEFKANGNVSGAAREAGIARSTAYEWRETDLDFAKAWEEAENEAVDTLEREAWRRARDGVVKTHGVYYKDELLETVEETTYSDTLLIFLMKAHRPQKYRETTRTEIVDIDMSELSDDELRTIAAGQISRRR
jgi:transposase-like protein